MSVSAPTNPLLRRLEDILESINTISDGMPTKSKYRALMTELQRDLKDDLGVTSNSRAVFDRFFLAKLDDVLTNTDPAYLIAINAAAVARNQHGVDFTLKLKTLRSLIYRDLMEHAALGCCGLRTVRKVTQAISGIALGAAVGDVVYNVVRDVQTAQANASAGAAEFLPAIISAISSFLYVLQTRDILRLQTSLNRRHADPPRNTGRLIRANLILWGLTIACAAVFGSMFYLYNFAGDQRLFLSGIGAGALMGASTFLPMAIAASYLLCYSQRPMEDADIARAIAAITALPQPPGSVAAGTARLLDHADPAGHVEMLSGASGAPAAADFAAVSVGGESGAPKGLHAVADAVRVAMATPGGETVPAPVPGSGTGI